MKKQLDLFKNMNVKKDFNSVLHKLDELMNAGSSNNQAQLNSGSLDKIGSTLKDAIEQLYNKLSMKMDENLDRSMMNMQNVSFTGMAPQDNAMFGNATSNQGGQRTSMNAGAGSDQARMNEIARDSIVPHIALDYENKVDGLFMSKINEFIPINNLSSFTKKEHRDQAMQALLIDAIDTNIRVRENEKLMNERMAEVTRNLKEGMLVKDMLIKDLFEAKNNLMRKDDEIKILESQLEESTNLFDRQVEKMKGRIDEMYNEHGADTSEAK